MSASSIDRSATRRLTLDLGDPHVVQALALDDAHFDVAALAAKRRRADGVLQVVDLLAVRPLMLFFPLLRDGERVILGLELGIQAVEALPGIERQLVLERLHLLDAHARLARVDEVQFVAQDRAPQIVLGRDLRGLDVEVRLEPDDRGFRLALHTAVEDREILLERFLLACLLALGDLGGLFLVERPPHRDAAHHQADVGHEALDFLHGVGLDLVLEARVAAEFEGVDAAHRRVQHAIAHVRHEPCQHAALRDGAVLLHQAKDVRRLLRIDLQLDRELPGDRDVVLAERIGARRQLKRLEIRDHQPDRMLPGNGVLQRPPDAANREMAAGGCLRNSAVLDQHGQHVRPDGDALLEHALELVERDVLREEGVIAQGDLG